MDISNLRDTGMKYQLEDGTLVTIYDPINEPYISKKYVAFRPNGRPIYFPPNGEAFAQQILLSMLQGLRL